MNIEATAVDPVQVVEDEVAREREDHKEAGARMLSEEEWAKVMPPFYYIEVNFDQWTNLEYEIAVKFVVKNGTGWVYYRDKRFIFEKEDDYVLFRMWAENKPMQEKDTVFAIK